MTALMQLVFFALVSDQWDNRWEREEGNGHLLILNYFYKYEFTLICMNHKRVVIEMSFERVCVTPLPYKRKQIEQNELFSIMIYVFTTHYAFYRLT